MTIYNIVDCVPRVGSSRIEQAKYNIQLYMDNKSIMMTNDLHVPVTSAAL